jgi:hypothetical protein
MAAVNVEARESEWWHTFAQDHDLELALAFLYHFREFYNYLVDNINVIYISGTYNYK